MQQTLFSYSKWCRYILRNLGSIPGSIASLCNEPMSSLPALTAPHKPRALTLQCKHGIIQGHNRDINLHCSTTVPLCPVKMSPSSIKRLGNAALQSFQYVHSFFSSKTLGVLRRSTLFFLFIQKYHHLCTAGKDLHLWKCQKMSKGQANQGNKLHSDRY